ncbi:hypothetical protein [uncultured Desulfuromonas sp.]|mgnify:CR=1 FL=1|uniref:hypothetical protein n=1 Tax=uncultured Desulfuromonas sp. TaxID=181013 RepID=UPI002622CB71|nr:hypothetical protein [uncultured Desulfuromonas sp.]
MARLGSCFFIVILLVVSGCGELSSSDHEVKQPPSLHYYQQAPDLIDVARFAKEDYAAGEGTSTIAVTDAVIKTLGDYLGSQGGEVYGTSSISAKPLTVDGVIPKYNYGNWLIKVAETAAVRLLEARFPEMEAELLGIDERAIYALPFRFIVLPGTYEGKEYVYVCAVDPLNYLSQFLTPSSELRSKLEEARKLLVDTIAGAFPEVQIDPQYPEERFSGSAEATPIVEIAVAAGSLSAREVADKVLAGNVVMFKGEAEQHGYQVDNGSDDYAHLLPGEAIFQGVMAFGTFSAIKDGWLKVDGVKTYFPDWKIANQSEQMEHLVPNSILHVFDDAKLLEYRLPSGETVYQMQVFDGYISPFLMHNGIWHFASLPISVYFKSSSPDVIEVQNPVYSVQRNFQDVSETTVLSKKEAWDANAKNKTLWPVLSKEEMARFTLQTIENLLIEALN